MPRLPVLLSVPHAGLATPPEVEGLSGLSVEQIEADIDGGAAAAYLPLRDRVTSLVTTGIARVFLDVNRSEHDRGRHGVAPTHTSWNVPIYTDPPGEDQIKAMLAAYHRPYHQTLAREGGRRDIVLGVDAHTMAPFAPPVAPDPLGTPRPQVCVSDAGGSLPTEWLETLTGELRERFGDVRVNGPYEGGQITQERPGGLPWVQVELSRAPFLPDAEKGRLVLEALAVWARRHAASVRA